MVIATKNIIEIIARFKSVGFKNFERVSENMNKNINKQITGISRQSSAFLSADKKITSLSKNIEKNNAIIKEQTSLRQTKLGDNAQLLTGLRAENREYSKQKKELESGMGTVNKELGLNRKRISMFKNVAENTKMNKIAQMGFFKTMKLGQPDFKRFNELGRTSNKIGGKIGMWARNATHGLRGFRMEMLGVMFFGMSMMRVFTGLFKTSMEWMGVMDILSLALGILFLPVAELMLEWALSFLNWVTKLSPETKKFIGWLALMGAALGALLMVFGTLALGIGSIILAFGWLISPMGIVLGLIASIAGAALFKKFFDNGAESVDNLRSNLMGFGLSGEVFDTMKEKIIEWYDVAKKYLFGDETTGEVGLITNIKNKILEFADSEDVKTAGSNLMKKLVEGAKKFFTDNPMVLIGAIVGGLLAGPLGASIGAAVGLGFEKIDLEKMDEVISKGTEILDGIINGLVENQDKIANAMDKILTALSNWINNNSEEIIELGVTIGVGIAKGLLRGFKDALLADNFFTKWTGISDVVNVGKAALDYIDKGRTPPTPNLQPSVVSTPSGQMSVSNTFNINAGTDKNEMVQLVQEGVTEGQRKATEDFWRIVGGQA